MRLGAGPLKVRIEAEGLALDEVLAQAAAEGLVLALPDEEADLVARPAPAARPGQRATSALSPRELEILGYLVDGWSNAEIASALRIGLRTVRFHLEGIYGKLGVARRGEAAREALRLGLVRFEA
jgi:ATP/maltotriose-dependent transcriptional regulator MalT